MLGIIYLLLNVPIWFACICSAITGHFAGRCIASWWPETGRRVAVQTETYRQVSS